MTTRRPLYELTRNLVDVAMGRCPAELVIRNGRWVNVCSGEIIADTGIAIYQGRIAYCGRDTRAMIGEKTEVIDAEGRFLVPGLLDAHMHVESSMLTLTQFACAVLSHGTTTIFIDPHEIANVLGLTGVKLILNEARTLPLRAYVQIPSCVPAAPGLETAGAQIGPEKVAEALTWPGVIGLGEVMNYPGVIASEEAIHAEIAATFNAGGIVGGHYASPDLGAAFHAYAAAGVSDCHEGRRPEDAIARVRQGMYAILRHGSAWHDAAVQVQAVTKQGIDPRRILLCTDDRHAETLLTDGHMDDVVRLMIKEGVAPLTAIQMATLNTAEHFGVSGDLGCIAPGRYADILIVSDLEQLTIDRVIAAGETVAVAGRLAIDIPSYTYPETVMQSVHLAQPLVADDFVYTAPIEAGTVQARVIEVVENQVITRVDWDELPVVSGVIRPDVTADIAFLAVIERHQSSGRIGRGLVKGFGLTSGCALASTVAHDSHNLLVMGTDPTAMARAANRVAEMNGGVCLVRGDAVAAEIPLSIAGLMSTEPVEKVAAQAEQLHYALHACGCTINNGFMTFSLLALPVIPQLRLTDLGLVDVMQRRIVPLFLSSG